MVKKHGRASSPFLSLLPKQGFASAGKTLTKAIVLEGKEVMALTDEEKKQIIRILEARSEKTR